MSARRLLFASIHGYLDPSSGAALATRELLEQLAARGWDCRALACGVLDYEQETPLEEVLAAMEAPLERAEAALNRRQPSCRHPVGARTDENECTRVLGPPSLALRAGITGKHGREEYKPEAQARVGNVQIPVWDGTIGGVRVTLMPTKSSRAEHSPDAPEGAMFLALAEQVLERFEPAVMLTYGGHWVSLELMRRARARGVAVVFHLHNFSYHDIRGFADVSAVLFPSEYSRRFYRRSIGLGGVVIPDLIELDRVIAADPDPTYVTFINPQPDKGMTVFARIALELERRRPGIPLLVVEGRGKSEGLARLPVDLSGLGNLNRMENTPDPRDFYRVSRVVLMPSLWRESLGRVAVEAMANGIPVLASDRGALPETLGEAGFVFTSPARYVPANAALPTAREVAPWVAVIERLWDDRALETRQRRLATEEAGRWAPERLVERYEEFLERISDGSFTVGDHAGRS